MAEQKRYVAVAGGAGGIGVATVSALLEANFTPVVLDLQIPPTVNFSPDVVVWPDRFDLTDVDAIPDIISAIEEQCGPLQGVVNAAGVLGRMHPPAKLPVSVWDHELAVDLRGPFLLCRAVGTLMAARGFGSIVNVASIAGMTGAPTHGYSAAKAGLIQLTQTLAAEWGRHGVRVNAVSPGFTRTGALEASFKSGALNETRITERSALGRLVEPSEVARAIAWLIGSASSGITGVNLPVDAGFIAGSTWPAYCDFR